MRRRVALFVAVLMAVGALQGGVVSVSAALPGEVRVGLESKWKAQANIAIDHKTVAVGYDALGPFMPMVSLTAHTGFAVRQIIGHYVLLPFVYAGYEQTRAAADSIGANAVPHAMPEGFWRLYVGPFASAAAAEVYAVGIGATVHPHNDGLLVLTDGGAPVLMFDDWFQLTDGAGGFVSLGGAQYRGRMEFRASGAGVSAINVLPMDLYLYGVVPMEMPAGFRPEALKAQAVAARTYALSKEGSHSGGPYTLCDTTHCQVYGGVARETGVTTSAVDATSGMAIYYGGAPIEAMFFASSGGYTERSENVWGAGLPYLVSVKEMNEPPGAWSRTFSFEELDGLVAANGAFVGSVMSVEITAASDSGRVQELTLVGSMGLKSLKKEEIRTFFSKSEGGSLNSRMFSLLNGEPAASQALSTYAVGAGGVAIPLQLDAAFAVGREDALFNAAAARIQGQSGLSAQMSAAVSSVPRGAGLVTFSGSGNGHGVGMSQHGANGMAQLGYTFEQILRHYYTGVEVR